MKISQPRYIQTKYQAFTELTIWRSWHQAVSLTNHNLLSVHTPRPPRGQCCHVVNVQTSPGLWRLKEMFVTSVDPNGNDEPMWYFTNYYESKPSDGEMFWTPSSPPPPTHTPPLIIIHHRKCKRDSRRQ